MLEEEEIDLDTIDAPNAEFADRSNSDDECWVPFRVFMIVATVTTMACGFLADPTLWYTRREDSFFWHPSHLAVMFASARHAKLISSSCHQAHPTHGIATLWIIMPGAGAVTALYYVVVHSRGYVRSGSSPLFEYCVQFGLPLLNTIEYVGSDQFKLWFSTGATLEALVLTHTSLLIIGWLFLLVVFVDSGQWAFSEMSTPTLGFVHVFLAALLTFLLNLCYSVFLRDQGRKRELKSIEIISL